MANIIINNKARTIEINKTFAAKASIYGSKEYKELQSARRDYPNYYVVAVKQKGAKAEYKGLTYEYMEKYIKGHDDKEERKMNEYLMLRGLDDEGKKTNAKSLDYSDIKEWFFLTFPEIENYHKNREALLEKIAERKAAKASA